MMTNQILYFAYYLCYYLLEWIRYLKIFFRYFSSVSKQIFLLWEDLLKSSNTEHDTNAVIMDYVQMTRLYNMLALLLCI